MLGIVLWCGEKGKKAVIWCEDHGDLAFFEDMTTTVSGATLEVGDMVRFRTEEGRRMRRAFEVERVADQAFPGVVDAIKRNVLPDTSATVISFPGLPRLSCAAS